MKSYEGLIIALKEVFSIFRQVSESYVIVPGGALQHNIDEILKSAMDESTIEHTKIVEQSIMNGRNKKEVLGAAINAVLEYIDFSAVAGDAITGYIASFLRTESYVSLNSFRNVPTKEAVYTNQAGTTGSHLGNDFPKKQFPTRKRVMPGDTNDDADIQETIQSIKYFDETEATPLNPTDPATDSVNQGTTPEEEIAGGKDLEQATKDAVDNDGIVEMKTWNIVGKNIDGEVINIEVNALDEIDASMVAKSKGVLPYEVNLKEEDQDPVVNPDLSGDELDPEGIAGAENVTFGREVDDNELEEAEKNNKNESKNYSETQKFQEILDLFEDPQDRELPPQDDLAQGSELHVGDETTVITTDGDYAPEEDMAGEPHDDDNVKDEMTDKAGHPDDKPGDVNPAQIIEQDDDEEEDEDQIEQNECSTTSKKKKKVVKEDQNQSLLNIINEQIDAAQYITELDLTPGASNALSKVGGSDYSCPACGFAFPKYPGAYPKKCPSCQTLINKPETQEGDTDDAVAAVDGKNTVVQENKDSNTVTFGDLDSLIEGAKPVPIDVVIKRGQK